jgi:rhodanese-related sulfurtransferase
LSAEESPLNTLRRVSIDEVVAMLAAGAIYLDVRSDEEFEAGRPVGAINVPAEALHFVARVEARLPVRSQTIVVACEKGVRSFAAAHALLEAGYADVVEFRAGYAGRRDGFGRVLERGWRDAGLPIEYDD